MKSSPFSIVANFKQILVDFFSHVDINFQVPAGCGHRNIKHELALNVETYTAGLTRSGEKADRVDGQVEFGARADEEGARVFDARLPMVTDGRDGWLNVSTCFEA